MNDRPRLRAVSGQPGAVARKILFERAHPEVAILPPAGLNDRWRAIVSPGKIPGRPGETTIGLAGWRSGYVKVSGIAVPMSWNACRWALVGSVSIGMVTWVPVNRTWLRVKVARCSSRPRKLR